MTWKLASSRLKTGRQYTPVDSMATCVTAWLLNQAESIRSPAVVVAKVRTCLLTFPLAPVSSTQATTVFLCTSNPAQRAYNTLKLIALPLPFCYTSSGSTRGAAARGAKGTTRFLHVLTASRGDTQLCCKRPDQLGKRTWWYQSPTIFAGCCLF